MTADSSNARQQARIILDTVKLLRAHLYSSHVRAAKKSSPDAFELTEAQFGAMMAVKDNEPLSLKSLAEMLGVSAPSASAMVDRLVDCGMLRRGTSEHDRRQVQIDLSARGRAVLEDFESVFFDSATDLVEKIGPDYSRQLCEAYLRIQEVLRAERDEKVAALASSGDTAS